MDSAVPTDDRGLLLGDGLFETVLFKAGEPVLWSQHLAEAEALFLTSSLIGVRAAASLDGRPFAPHPLVGELAARLDPVS